MEPGTHIHFHNADWVHCQGIAPPPGRSTEGIGEALREFALGIRG
jgi:hypothetical protein